MTLLKKLRLRKKHIPSFHFKKVPKIRNVIEELFTFPVILEMKNGKFFAGVIDDYESRIIVLFMPKQLVDKKISEKNPSYTEHVWEDYFEDTKDSLFADIPMKDIKNIYRAKDESLALDLMLELVLNPFQKPNKILECNWAEDKIHADDCDEDLHESLTKLYEDGRGYQKTDEDRTKFDKAFRVIRRFIIENNGRIP